MVNIKIHRGTSQIGGTITEIYTENTHIFIDFGSELTVNPEDSTDSKMIEMIKNAKCDAVLFSHYHGDHVGMLEHIIIFFVCTQYVYDSDGSIDKRHRSIV